MLQRYPRICRPHKWTPAIRVFFQLYSESSDLPIKHYRTRANAQTACYPTHTHSYYNASSGICWCSNGTPFQSNLQVGSKDNCGTNYDNRLTRTSYMSLEPQCYANRPAGLTTVNQFTGLNGCLNSCKNGLRATFWANTASGVSDKLALGRRS
jgi:hypothetical protein